MDQAGRYFIIKNKKKILIDDKKLAPFMANKKKEKMKRPWYRNFPGYQKGSKKSAQEQFLFDMMKALFKDKQERALVNIEEQKKLLQENLNKVADKLSIALTVKEDLDKQLQNQDLTKNKRKKLETQQKENIKYIEKYEKKKQDVIKQLNQMDILYVEVKDKKNSNKIIEMEQYKAKLASLSGGPEWNKEGPLVIEGKEGKRKDSNDLESIVQDLAPKKKQEKTRERSLGVHEPKEEQKKTRERSLGVHEPSHIVRQQDTIQQKSLTMHQPSGFHSVQQHKTISLSEQPSLSSKQYKSQYSMRPSKPSSSAQPSEWYGSSYIAAYDETGKKAPVVMPEERLQTELSIPETEYGSEINEERKELPQSFLESPNPWDTEQWKQYKDFYGEEKYRQKHMQMYGREPSEFGEGKHKSDDGTSAEELLRMIVTLLPESKNYTINYITSDKEKIKWEEDNDGCIIVFLKDSHFTCAIYDRKDYCIMYFDPYGNTGTKERRQRDLKQLQQLSLEVSPEITLKLKWNEKDWQENGLVENDSSYCAWYCLIWLFNILVQNMSWKESTYFTKQDKRLMESLTLAKSKYPFI